MIIQCNKCQKQYKVNPEKITEQGTKITCPACGHQFIVRRKAGEPPPEPQAKTPPCRVCGQPSTHVLQGDPPLPLCERCFQVEKEKKTRFAPESFAPPPATEEAPPPETKPPPPPPAPVEPSPETPSRKYLEGEYFDTFDEIPDLSSDENTLGPSSLTEAAEPEIKPPPETQPPPAPVHDPFAGERIQLESDEADLAAPSPPAEPASPAAAQFEFEAEAEEAPPPAPAPPARPPARAPAPPAAPVAEFTAPRGGLSLEDEVERSLAREKDESAQAPAELPSSRPLRDERRHWPAYLILGGAIVAVLLAAAYFLLQTLGGGAPGEELAQVKPPLPAVPATAPSQPPAEIPPAAPAPASPDPAKPKQLEEKFRLFHEFFLRDTADGYQKAIKELDQALTLVPDQPAAAALKMETYAFLTSLSDNFLYRRTAAKLIDQASAEAQLQTAFQRAKIHQFLLEQDTRAARKALETFLPENPGDGIGYYLLAMSYLQDQPPDYATAEENLEKAVSRAPELTRAYFVLADVYQAQKEPEKAQAVLRKVLELSPQKKEAGVALAKLEAAAKAKLQTPAPTTAPTPAPISVKPALPTPAPATGGTVEAKIETPASQPLALPQHVTDAVKPAGGVSSPSGLAATGEALADNLREIISEVSRPLSRVPAPVKAEPPPNQPPTPPEAIPPEERSSQ